MNPDLRQTLMEDRSREWQIHIRSVEAVQALVYFLHSYNWQAKEEPWGANDIPPDGVKVRVGLYPAATYVSPPGAKDFATVIAQFEQERQMQRIGKGIRGIPIGTSRE